MKSKLYFSFLGFTLFCAAMLFLSRIFEGNFLLELIISFLPLATLGLAALFIVAMIWTAQHFKKVPVKNRLTQSIVIGWILLLSLSSLIFSIIQVTSALDNTVLAHERDLEKNTQHELRVAFFNKYYYNENYKPLLEEVENSFIDILGMAELTETQYQAIKEQISLPYSYYTNCHCHSMMADPVAIFSRYPLSEIKTDGFVDSGIIEAKVMINETTEAQIVVIHPDAPMNGDYLTRRNILLRNLDIIIQKYRDKKFILMGDFNLSTWSPTFTNFLTNNPFLKDSARGFGLQTTWGPYFIRTKIDHIFVSQDIAVKDFTVQKMEGSDHEMIVTRLGI